MNFHVIPQPLYMAVTNENHSEFQKIKVKNNPLSKTAFQDFLSFFDFETKDSENLIFIKQTDLPDEGYRLCVSRGIITINYALPNGAFYALQTLKQLLLQGNLYLPDLEIIDRPAFPYRGLMLDCGRYYFRVEDVKKFLDIAAMHKLNRLHWHLTEDQGWRMEIKKYPLLTEIGSRRSHTNFNNKPHAGFYTQEEIREIVSYAAEKYIQIIPELDVPGHCRAAIAAYSELTCFPRELPVATHWGVKHDILCSGKESTFQFVFDIIDEMCAMFPTDLFHIGGDEVPKHRWKHCPNCQKRLQQEHLADEEQLQEYFMNRIAAYLHCKGKRAMMWKYGEYEPNKLDKKIGFSICSGKSEGAFFVDTSTKAFYFDLPYGYIPLKAVLEHEILTGALGAEAQLWTEYIPSMKKAQIMLFPRLGAMSEKVWNGKTDYAVFLEKLDSYYSFLKKNGFSYSRGAATEPKRLRKLLQILWFERRQLHWEGLKNILEDKKIERLVKKAHENSDKKTSA